MSLVFDVDEAGLVRALARVVDKVGDLAALGARELEGDLRSEAGQVSSRLGAPWNIDGIGPNERHVVAPEWWAHILAHGSAPHGPTKADRMVFAIDGQTIGAMYVRGVPATNFDERAIDRARSRIDDILRRLIEEAT